MVTLLMLSEVLSDCCEMEILDSGMSPAEDTRLKELNDSLYVQQCWLGVVGAQMTKGYRRRDEHNGPNSSEAKERIQQSKRSGGLASSVSQA